MTNFTLTGSDAIATPDFVSRTVMTTGGTLSNGDPSKAGIALRIFTSIFEWRRLLTGGWSYR
jgi:hypothetical protein